MRSDQSDRWAVILAGGDGTRLRPLTRLIAGDDRPKQFCRILEGETLVLAVRPSDLTVLPVAGVRWDDWGEPHRVFSDLRKIGKDAALRHRLGTSPG